MLYNKFIKKSLNYFIFYDKNKAKIYKYIHALVYKNF